MDAWALWAATPAAKPDPMGKVFVGGQGGSLAAAVVVQRAELDKILEEVCLAGSPTLLLAARRRIGAPRRSV
jgi:hypothetical protein